MIFSKYICIALKVALHVYRDVVNKNIKQFDPILFEIEEFLFVTVRWWVSVQYYNNIVLNKIQPIVWLICKITLQYFSHERPNDLLFI